ncbi:PQQ-binding-like beta-propeller repeat protein [Acidobacteria bacterium AH-259-L09]|nr:PQQ-binding-like beta-propeller repeat protein [Acidobacteria bacterium AH-259-L09]
MGATVSLSLGARNEPLWSAARDGKLEDVRDALAAGAKVDAKGEGGATALFYAAQYGHAEVVEFLAGRGADVNVAAVIDIGDRSYRVTALGAAALGGYADVVRALLKHGADPPEYMVISDGLSRSSVLELQRSGRDITGALRDWEVITSILRTPEVEAITHEIVLQDAQGVYRSHDGQRYEVRVQDRTLRLAAADGSVVRLQSVGGNRFAQRGQLDPEPPQVVERREIADQRVTMLRRWLQRVPPEEREKLLQQYLEHGGVWLDFIIGEGQVLGFNFRDGGPRYLGGPPLLFRKLDTRPAEWPSVERGITSTSPVVRPMNWPSFRGPHASGVADRQFPPTSWDAEQSINIRWKTPIPGLGNSSPIIWGDKIFITTAISSQANPVFRPGNMGDTAPAGDQSEHVWKLYCIDRLTGKILWERTAYKGNPRAGRHLKSTFANPTPVTDGQHVVAFFGPEGLYCYDMEGTLIWQKDFGIVGMPLWGFASSPIIYRDMVIVQCDTVASTNPAVGQLSPAREERLRGQRVSSSFIGAFNLADGSERWRTTRDEPGASFGTPTVVEARGRVQLIANGGARIRAYDPMTGKELWSLAARTRNVTPTPIVAHDLIFVTSGFRPIQPIYAIRPNAAGDITLEEGEDANEFIAWSRSRGGSYTPTPIVYGEYLYAVNVSGILACYEAKTGKRMYRARLRHMGGGISSSPVAADGRLYFSSEDGDVFVVKAGPEFELLSTNSMGEVIMATPAISGNMMFIRTLHHLVAIG